MQLSKTIKIKEIELMIQFLIATVLKKNQVFLTAISLSLGKFWVILEGTASLTWRSPGVL